VTVKANVLTVDVWDSSALKHVESAIHKANLPGISPQRDTTAIRIPVARPTGDVRREILKQLHETLEAAKGQIRIARTDALKALGGRGEEGTDDVQKATDRVSGEIDKLQQSAKKELEK
jgi:ribosome recycling factor